METATKSGPTATLSELFLSKCVNFLHFLNKECMVATTVIPEALSKTPPMVFYVVAKRMLIENAVIADVLPLHDLDLLVAAIKASELSSVLRGCPETAFLFASDEPLTFSTNPAHVSKFWAYIDCFLDLLTQTAPAPKDGGGNQSQI